MPERDRDQSVEHVLRRVLAHDGPASPGEACVDGETMAAWTAGALRTDEASAVENHVAGCARCRGLMAAFIKTTPDEPPTESLWRPWHLGWVVPVATAVTAAAIWISLPETTVPVSSVQDRDTLAQGERSATAPAATPAPPEATAAAPSAPPATAARERLQTFASNEERQRLDETADRRKSITSPAPAPAPAPAAAPAAVAEPLAKQRAEADQQEAAAGSASRPLAATAAAARLVRPPVEIVAPGGSARWRITNGQQVEWSSTAAADWGPATLASPDILSSGAAPSASVCWIVGRRGAVYLTTDGARFMRVPFPVTVDLVSVTATDDRNATVSAADGRSWQTTDQGQNWSMGR